jgi:hypothetical protein
MRDAVRGTLAIASGIAAVAAVTSCGSGRAETSAPAVPAVPAASATARTPAGSLAAAPIRAPGDSGPGPRAATSAPPADPATRLAGRAAFVPRTLRLPSGRSATVLAQGTRPDGRLQVPDDPAAVAWWSGGSRPGDPYGTVVLAGHIDSRTYGVGVLAELVTAAPGATVRVAAGGDGETYRITRVTQVPKDRTVNDTGAFDRAGPPRLVLITCGGAFDPGTGHYEDNVVVTAEPGAP